MMVTHRASLTASWADDPSASCSCTVQCGTMPTSGFMCGGVTAAPTRLSMFTPNSMAAGSTVSSGSQPWASAGMSPRMGSACVKAFIRFSAS